MHFGYPADGIFPLVSMLGDLVPVVTGAALAFKRRGQPRVAMTFLGEGAFSVGDTHEGLNLAAVWQVPAVFVIQSNRYSYSTPVARQMVNTNIAQRIFGGWSIPAERVDGTDAIAVLDDRARRGRAGPRTAAARRRSRRSRCGCTVTLDTTTRATCRPACARSSPSASTRSRGSRPGSRSTASAPPRSTALREEAADEVAAGLAEAEEPPAADPATLENGVYAAPPFR